MSITERIERNAAGHVVNAHLAGSVQADGWEWMCISLEADEAGEDIITYLIRVGGERAVRDRLDRRMRSVEA